MSRSCCNMGGVNLKQRWSGASLTFSLGRSLLASSSWKRCSRFSLASRRFSFCSSGSGCEGVPVPRPEVYHRSENGNQNRTWWRWQARPERTGVLGWVCWNAVLELPDGAGSSRTYKYGPIMKTRRQTAPVWKCSARSITFLWPPCECFPPRSPHSGNKYHHSCSQHCWNTLELQARALRKKEGKHPGLRLSPNQGLQPQEDAGLGGLNQLKAPSDAAFYFTLFYSAYMFFVCILYILTLLLYTIYLLYYLLSVLEHTVLQCCLPMPWFFVRRLKYFILDKQQQGCNKQLFCSQLMHLLTVWLIKMI